MSHRRPIFLPISITLLLTACGDFGASDPPPVTQPQQAYLRTADVEAVVQNVYTTDAALRAKTLTTFFGALGAGVSLPALRQSAEGDAHPWFDPARDVSRLLLGLDEGFSVTLESWITQVHALGYRGANGEPLSADALEAQLAELVEKPELRPAERMLAVVAHISKKRMQDQEPTRVFGDGLLDPLQLFLLNGYLVALGVPDAGGVAAQAIHAQGDDPTTVDLDFFKSAYGTVKEFFSDAAGAVDGIKRAGQFMDCAAFLTSNSSLRVSTSPSGIWYKKIGPPSESAVTATAILKGSISDSDLRYYAAAGCAPSASRTLPGVTVRWLMGPGSGRHGSLANSEGTTDIGGQALNTFVAAVEDSPQSAWKPENQRTANIKISALMSGFSKAYPYLEARSIDLLGGAKDTQALAVNYYQQEVFEGPFTYHQQPRNYGGWGIKATGRATWAPDPDRPERLVLAGGTVTYTWTSQGDCEIIAPTLTVDLNEENATGQVVFYDDLDGKRVYGAGIRLTTAPEVTLIRDCPGPDPYPDTLSVPGGHRVMLVFLDEPMPTDDMIDEFSGDRVRVVDANGYAERYSWKWKRELR